MRSLFTPVACYCLGFLVNIGNGDTGPCAFRGNHATCIVVVGKVPVHTSVIVNHCHQPVDVTFMVKVDRLEIDWRHTFVTTNSAESQEIPGFPEKVLLHVTLSKMEGQDVALRADYHTQNEDSNFFLDTTLHLAHFPDCKQLASSNASHIVAGVMMPLLLLVLATGGILMYCKCRKSTLDQMALVENVAGLPGASPYQEGNPRVGFSKRGSSHQEVVIENSFALSRTESIA